MEIVQFFSRARHANEGGVELFGPDLSKWPIQAVDAAVLIDIERIREANTRIEAQSRES